MHGVHIIDQVVLTNENLSHGNIESMAGVSEKMMSVATASFLCRILKAGNLDLKCFLMGYLVDATAH